MGNYDELKQAVSNVIKTNGNQEITGQLLQNTLLSIISIIGANATFAGIATPDTNPGELDANVFYLASKYGNYVNFGNIKVNNDRLSILYNKNNTWEVVEIDTWDNALFYKNGNRSGVGDNIIINAVKSIKLIGDWNKSKKYFVEEIDNNDLSYHDRFVISSINDSGEVTTEYDTGSGYIVKDGTKNGLIFHIFPVIDGKYIEAVIDYSEITHVDVRNTSNLIVRDFLIYNGNDDYSIFLLNNSSNFKLEEKNIIYGIYAITLIGEWEPNKTYALDEINRGSSSNYRFVIKEINPDTGELISYIYDTRAAYTITEKAGVNIIRFPLINGRAVILSIDWDKCMMLGERVVFTNNAVINNSNIVYNKYSEIYNTQGLITKNLIEKEKSVVEAIKSITLFGNWDTKKMYALDEISRNNVSYNYRFVIKEINPDTGELISYIYDTGAAYTVTENQNGYTLVIMPLINDRQVILLIDYSKIINGSYTVFTNNAVINNSNIVYYDSNVKIGSNTHLYGEEGTIIDKFYKSDLIPAFDNQDRYRQIIMGKSSKKGFICLRSDDTPRVDLEWIKILDTFGLKYSLCANVPYYAGFNTAELMRSIQQRGHEIIDHTAFHTTFYTHVPEKYMRFFQKYIDSGDIVRIQDDTAGGVLGKRITLKTVVKENYLEHQFGIANSYQLTAGSNLVSGDFTSMVLANPLVYIDNQIGEKIGWILAAKTDNNTLTLSNNDGTAPIPTESETITLYVVEPTAFNYSLTENATYCLLLAGQCWFTQAGLKKPLIWNQPGGVMPFVDREILSRVLKKLGMKGGETDQTLIEGAKATYNYYAPYPNVCYNWEGGILHFDECDGSDDWLNQAKALISDYVAKRNIRTMATHFIYSNFPGSTNEEKRENFLKWFYNLFEWMSSAEIEVLTLEERDFIIDYTATDRYANVFPELYYDRANRGKPDGYTITNTNVLYTDNGRPESKNKALELYGTGNVFKINNLGGLEKGKMLLRGFLKSSTSAAKVTISTSQGLTIPSWNQLPYTPTLDEITFNNYNQWREFEIELDIPYTMNYINISLDVENVPTEKVIVSGITLIGK